MTMNDPHRLSSVLAGMSYPARTWQLLAEADSYGADAQTREALSRLPVATYADLSAVMAELRDIQW
jgi:hypothetical protein